VPVALNLDNLKWDATFIGICGTATTKGMAREIVRKTSSKSQRAKKRLEPGIRKKHQGRGREGEERSRRRSRVKEVMLSKRTDRAETWFGRMKT
jgi:hypothetical protein